MTCRAYVKILFILTFLLCRADASVEGCYCTENSHHMIGVGFSCINNVCKKKSDSDQCYATSDVNGNLDKGCMIFTRCYDLSKSAHDGKYLHCCKDNMCNKNLTRNDLKVYVLHPDEYKKNNRIPKIQTDLPEEKVSKKSLTGRIAAAISVPLSVIFLVLTFLVIYISHRKKKLQRKNSNEQSSMLIAKRNEMESIHLSDFATSGSGAGLPLLVQRTIARQIVLHECIGAGRFGAVHRGSWHGQDVAVKIFSTNEEASWFREAQIYQTTMLRHENVLGFIAADNKDTGTCTQLWLITEYHALGSVYDFLQVNTLTLNEMIHMVFSIVNGLTHLHMEVVGTEGKPAMAHRDMKTKNILVKNNKTCSIADLGLTVLHTSINNKVDMPTSTRTGTRRYQAPEILEDVINLRYFDAYRRADVYALSLCIWEICRRTTVEGQCEEYQLPYYDCVNPDPSHEEMRHAVCVEHRRPVFPKYWYGNEAMKSFLKIMKECWYENSAARLTALRIKKNILSICKDLDIKL